MDWFWIIFIAILAVATIVGLFTLRLQRRRIGAGQECWQCGSDLSGCGARIDGRGDRRCPKCGELIEPDLPGGLD